MRLRYAKRVLPSRLRSLARDRSGSTAIEFGFVAVPMVFTVLATIVTGLNYGELAALDAAARHAGRELQLGHVADIGDTTIRRLMCNAMVGLVPNCMGSLQIYVGSGSSFSAITKPTFSDTTMSPQSYSPGTNGSYVILRVGYVTTFGTSILGSTGFLTPGGLSLNVSPFVISSTVAFQNEPAASAQTAGVH